MSRSQPSGGALSTVADCATLLQALLAGGRLPGGARVFEAATARALTTCQTDGVATIPGTVRDGWASHGR